MSNNKLELAEGRVIIKPDAEELELYTPNGLYLGKKKKPSPLKKGIIVQIHPDIYQVEVGNKVYYEGKGSPIEVLGESCLNIPIDNVVGVIS